MRSGGSETSAHFRVAPNPRPLFGLPASQDRQGPDPCVFGFSVSFPPSVERVSRRLHSLLSAVLSHSHGSLRVLLQTRTWGRLPTTRPPSRPCAPALTGLTPGVFGDSGLRGSVGRRPRCDAGHGEPSGTCAERAGHRPFTPSGPAGGCELSAASNSPGLQAQGLSARVKALVFCAGEVTLVPRPRGKLVTTRKDTLTGRLSQG